MDGRRRGSEVENRGWAEARIGGGRTADGQRRGSEVENAADGRRCGSEVENRGRAEARIGGGEPRMGGGADRRWRTADGQ